MKNARYIIFGASGGIGRAVCQSLAARQAQLVLAGRNTEALQALAESVGTGTVCTADARRSAEVDAVFAHTVKELGGVDGVVNCVGSLFLKPPHLTSDEQFAEHLAINLHSAFYILRGAARTMDKKQGGSVVLLSTVAARFGLPNHEVIAAAKGGIQGLVMSAASTYAVHNIRVNAIAPGLIETPLTKSLTAGGPMAEASAALHPLGRFGQPDDIASAIVFLLDPAHNFITGQVWGIDGGMSRARAPTRAPVRQVAKTQAAQSPST